MSEEKSGVVVENVVEMMHLGPPPEVTEEEYTAAEATLLHAVNAMAAVDPLGVLDEGQEEVLVRLAYHDPVRTDRLERVIKEAMRQANYDNMPISKFSMSTYRRGAKHLERRVAEASSRRAKMRARNMRVVDGDDTRERLKNVPEDAEATVQEWAYSTAPILQACAWVAQNRKGRVWFDEFHNQFFTDWDGSPGDTLVPVRPLEDQWLLRAHTTILSQDVRLAKCSLMVTENALRRVAADDVRNEPRAWLRSLQWDGVERLPTWLSKAFGVEANRYHADVGRCWMVSIAARIEQPGCKVDTMPVLVGPQGTSKSSALEALGGKWYVAVNVSLEKPQDFLATLAGKLVAELPELDAINSLRVSKQRVKALLSTASDVYRPPYGKVALEFKRTAVFAGTTNDVGWHGDETGARRFWPIECWGDIDLQWIRDNREQLYAEAAARLAKGEQWWDFDRGEQERRMASHYIEDPLVDRMRDVLRSRRDLYTGHLCGVEVRVPDPMGTDERSHWGNLITISWVATVVLGVPVGQQTGQLAKKIAHALKKVGLVNERVRISSGRAGLRVRAWVGQQGKWVDEESEQVEMAV
jgi:hypothetical protein